MGESQSPITGYPSLVADVCALACLAGDAILEVYESDFSVEAKDDRSPLTAADRASHRVIAEGLRRLAPDVPVLSEEGRSIPAQERQGWQRLWIVDPLDGTKEFIKRNGEFTVNIALVEDDAPVFGVVYVPVSRRLYWGGRDMGAWRQDGDGAPEPVRVRRPDPGRGLTVVQSRSHPSPELEAFLKELHVAESISVGSSLQLCAVAEGRADLYPRFGPTMEWDTAAGQAVVEGAGDKVLDQSGRALVYNKPDLLNPHFVVLGDWNPGNWKAGKL